MERSAIVPKQWQTAKFNEKAAVSTAAHPARDIAESVALVHDWCPSFRGGERVLSELYQTFQPAEIFTLFDFLPAEVKQRYFPNARFHTSALNALPWIEKYYRASFFACPFFMEQFDVTHFDAVISSSAAFARGIITRPDQPHVCYVHSPVRYAWDEQFNYLEQGNLGYGPKGLAFRYFMHRLRNWDVRTAHSPDVMVANSNFVRARIKRVYGRDALVVFPPVDLEEMAFTTEKDDYYVTASFLAPYKRTDLVVKAFRSMPNRRLVVVGEGQQSSALRDLAGPNIEFTGFLERSEYIRTVANARALVFAGCEDFGIALGEAQACGTPVIAFGRGGARDIVSSLGQSRNPTGFLFSRQTAESIVDAIEAFECNASAILPDACRENAGRFSADEFRRRMVRALELARDIIEHPTANRQLLALHQQDRLSD
ncbi:MAG: glycosyltransferase [Hyphomicrobium sp.]|nr:glycosyltransferase [Hyphomicrobium sp.]